MISRSKEHPPHEVDADAATVRVVHRSADGATHCDAPVDGLADALADQAAVTWVDVQSMGRGAGKDRVEAILRDVFRFHPLAIDDALTETHVPKLDDWQDYLYLVFQVVDRGEDDHPHLRELDVFLGANYLVTFHAGPLRRVDDLRQSLGRAGAPDRMGRGPDHLLYLLLDACVTDYLGLIEHLDDRIDAAQEEVFRDPTPKTLRKIFQVRRVFQRFHRLVSPTREVVNRLARDEYPQIDAPDRVYFRDVYDHLVRLHDLAESQRDLISGALDTYLSAISNRTNEVMKALTLVTVMFLPMTFIVGFFGMNFFGETLAFQSALPRRSLFLGSCAVMVATPFGLWYWAKSRKWF